MTPRKCLKCQQEFLSEKPKSQNRICPDCSKSNKKSYGKTAGGMGARRGGKGTGSGIDSD